MDFLALKPQFFLDEVNNISWRCEVARYLLEISSISAIICNC